MWMRCISEAHVVLARVKRAPAHQKVLIILQHAINTTRVSSLRVSVLSAVILHMAWISPRAQVRVAEGGCVHRTLA